MRAVFWNSTVGLWSLEGTATSGRGNLHSKVLRPILKTRWWIERSMTKTIRAPSLTPTHVVPPGAQYAIIYNSRMCKIELNSWMSRPMSYSLDTTLSELQNQFYSRCFSSDCVYILLSLLEGFQMPYARYYQHLHSMRQHSITVSRPCWLLWLVDSLCSLPVSYVYMHFIYSRQHAPCATP